MDFQSPRQRYTIYSIQLAQQFFFSWINRFPRILYAKEELKGHDSASFTLAACKLQLFYFIYNNCKVINIDLTWQSKKLPYPIWSQGQGHSRMCCKSSGSSPSQARWPIRGPPQHRSGCNAAAVPDLADAAPLTGILTAQLAKLKLICCDRFIVLYTFLIVL